MLTLTITLIPNPLKLGIKFIVENPPKIVLNDLRNPKKMTRMQTRHNFVGEIRIFSVKICINPYV